VIVMQKLCSEEKEKRPNPQDSSSFLSQTFYQWLTPLIDLGAERPLELDDVYNVPAALQSETVYDLFQSVWDEEQVANPGSGARNLAVMLRRCSRKPLIIAVVNFSIFALVSLAQPYFLVKILEYVATGEVNFLGVESGVLISLGLGLLSFIGIVCFSIAFTHIYECGFRTRNILIAKIFNKSLKISSFARNKQTTGDIVTLMAADTERIWMFILCSNWLWLAPAIIFISLLLLIIEFGQAAVVVTAVVALWFAVFYKSSSMVGSYRSRIVKLTGERVKLMNEALQGIRVIKLYAWETPIVDRIDRIRKQETDLMMQYQLTKMFNTVS
jgi:ATP-binding cassette subfamily C (CFTR/MRP) protein 1